MENHTSQLRKSGKKGFSLIEVLFAITFLLIVGVGVAALNNAASRLIEATELKVMALSLNEQSIAYVALQKRVLGDDFLTTYDCADSEKGGGVCYVICPETPTQECTLTGTPDSVQIGTAKISFQPQVRFVDDPLGGSKKLIIATTSWGRGVQRQISSSQIVE